MPEENLTQNEQRDQEQKDQQNPDMNESAALAACQDKVAALEDQVKYLSADFDNYRRNVEKDRAMWFIRAQGDVLKDVLQVVDDFDRAFNVAHKQIEEGKKTDLASWLEGFSFIREALGKMLSKYEVKEMESIGEFNPERHEALQQVESDEHESGTIVSVITKGYLYKGTVLRPAQVIVAK